MGTSWIDTLEARRQAAAEPAEDPRALPGTITGTPAPPAPTLDMNAVGAMVGQLVRDEVASAMGEVAQMLQGAVTNAIAAAAPPAAQPAAQPATETVPLQAAFAPGGSGLTPAGAGNQPAATATDPQAAAQPAAAPAPADPAAVDPAAPPAS